MKRPKYRLSGYRVWIGLLGLYILFLQSSLWTERRMTKELAQVEGAKGCQAQWEAIWAQVGPQVEAAQAQTVPPIPERQKWVRPRWGR